MSYTISDCKDEVLRVIPDEIRLFLDESLGFAMVRGEVISNFTKDTHIKGPIELAFECVQRFYPWPGIMKGTPVQNSPIESKVQITSLSLLPPNSQGIMPAGVQRFPFEFPIPTSLTPTIVITDRLEIEYQLAATVHLSSHQPHDEKYRMKWIDLTRHNSNKKQFVATTYLRIVKAASSNESAPPPPPPAQQIQASPTSPTDHRNIPSATAAPQLPWNRRGLDNYQSTYDEQHDSLALSLAGRSVGNISQPQNIDKYQGIRYKLGIDRTAIGLGTSINVEVMLEPTLKDAIVKGIVLKISERRRYHLKVPAGYTWGQKEPETKTGAEKATMVLKWARCSSFDEEEEDDDRPQYVRKCQSDSQYLTYFAPPYPGYFKTKLSSIPEDCCDSISTTETDYSECTHCPEKARELINLKEMYEVVRLGEFFGGRFQMPVPDCMNLLHPSVTSESVKIDHWLKLVVTVECNGEVFDLTLDTPGRILDCRLVNVDDEGQNLLPPPPSYQEGDEGFRWRNWTTYSFWQQREPITLKNEWGICMPCPCEVKQFRNAYKCGDKSNDDPSFRDWGPPPTYSKN